MNNTLLEQIQLASKDGTLTDQTADNTSYSYEPPQEGKTAARFVGYVEIGKRPQPAFKNKPKPDCLEAFLYFELLGKQHAKEIGEGDNKKTIYPILTDKVQIKSGEKANFTKMLKKMAYGRDIKHMAMMLGESFIVTVVHRKSKDGKKTYANIRTAEDGYLIEAPMYNANQDPLGTPDLKPLPVPEPTVPIKLFLWNNPTPEQWDSIFIDGSRTVEEDGVEKEISKNWLQEDIIENATDFEGSSLQNMLMDQSGMQLDGGQSQVGNESTETSNSQTNDPLADLGIDV